MGRAGGAYAGVVDQTAPRLVPALAVLLAVLFLGACAAGEPKAETPAPSGGTAETPAPTGLTASVDQARMDVAAGQVSVRLVNGSPGEVTVQGLTLHSTGFAPPMTYDRSGIVVDAGRAVDLRVSLSDAACAGGPLEHEAHLDVEFADGRSQDVVLPAVDVEGRLADLHETECFAAETEEVAVLTLLGPPQPRDLGGVLVADLMVQVRPQGGPGVLELVRVRNTTLLQLVDPDTAQRHPDGLPVEATVAGTDEPRDLVLTVVPARCDAHAVAEDKQGTRFRFDVVLDGREGTVSVAAPPEVTTALYDIVQQACGSRTARAGD